MPWVQTADLTPADVDAMPEPTRLQVYNGLDAMVTKEIRDCLRETFPQDAVLPSGSNVPPPAMYSFERALQGPYLEIMERGFAIDELARASAIREIDERRGALNLKLQAMAQTVWDKPLNPASPAQLKDFFYSDRGLQMPEVWISQKGVRRLSTNREALEKLETYLYARPFAAILLAMRDWAKQREVFATQMDKDGRFRSSYNIAGTESSRPSSSKNAFGTGRNAQNIDPRLRYVCVADPGYKLCVIDLEQVEARDVGWFCGTILGDWRFLDACESSDLHTANARLIWPDLPWTGDIKKDKKVAKGNFYRDFSYRDFAKRAGHLSNYSGSAWTASRVLKVPLGIMEHFQDRYCRAADSAYPCIARWWEWVATQLQTKGYIDNPFGMRRYFFGRPNDPATLREAIAHGPQSTTAIRMNLGLWRTWYHEPRVQLLAQTFDSITFQYKDLGHEYESDIIKHVLALLKVELRAPLPDGSIRTYSVPGEAKVGWNWGYHHDPSKPVSHSNAFNPDGLQNWDPKAPDPRTRQRYPLTSHGG